MPTPKKYGRKNLLSEILNLRIICYTVAINSMADFSFAVGQEGERMLTDNLIPDANPPVPKEGDLYKEITICGKTFQLLYGYYENFEREGPFNEPMPIYPDFIRQPHYTAEGIPIITAMQNICKSYSGISDEDSTCSDCMFFQKGEELFGLCQCPENKNSTEKGWS